MPAFYNVGDAQSEFNWIDEDFVPVGQAKPRNQVSITQLTIQLNGVIQPVTMHTKEHLMICIM